MNKYFEAWEVVYDLANELMKESETLQKGVQLLEASTIVLDRSGEVEHAKHLETMKQLKAEREQREQAARQPQLQLRTIEAQPQPKPIPAPRPRRNPMEKPDGHIAGVVNTEWGTFFNIKQQPS